MGPSPVTPEPYAEDPPLFALLVRALGTLTWCGLAGAIAGYVTGMVLGVWFLLMGAFVGGIIGIPVGYIAAIYGASFGGYRGWTFSGAVAGLLGGMCLFRLTSGDIFPIHPDEIPWFLFMTVPPTIAGLVNGYHAGQGILNAHSPFADMMAPLRVCLNASALYRLPIELRIMLATVHFAIAALIISRWLAHWGWTFASCKP